MNTQIKVGLVSDLHLEFGKSYMPKFSEDCDFIVLAGDINVGMESFKEAKWLSKTTGKKVVFVAGNHEFYHEDINDLTKKFKEMADLEENVFFLENDSLEFEIKGQKVRILGCSLWTDYKILGVENQIGSMLLANKSMNDHNFIMNNKRMFTPYDAAELHNTSKEFLISNLNDPYDGITMVLTHHAPHMDFNPPNYRRGKMCGAFTSDLTDVIKTFQPDIWICGHTHYNEDFYIGKTRLISNQMGYHGEPTTSNECWI